MMRAASDLLVAALTGSRTISSSLACYYNGSPVMDTVPISDGELTFDTSQATPGGLTVSVPRKVTDPDTGRVIDMLPTADDSPLACNGQQVVVSYTVSIPGHGSETLDLGWFRITDWEEGDGTIDITAGGLEDLIAEDRLLSTVQFATGTPMTSVATQLVAGLVPLVITADTTKTTSGRSAEDDRLDALDTLVDDWPARMYVDDSGTLTIAPPFDDDNDPIVLTLTDGENGTLVKAPASGNRDGVYNAVVASGESDGDTAPVSSVVYLGTGPRRWNGPYGNIPYFYSSPVLTTVAQCTAAATTRLMNLQVLANPVNIEAVPDPRLEYGDVIALRQTNDAGDQVTRVLRIDSIKLPLTYAETMTITAHDLYREVTS